MKDGNSNRGVLLKGALEGVPASSFELIADSISKFTQGKPGIYALYKEDRLYYVGLANSLKGRVNRHRQDRHAGKWNKFSIFVIQKRKYLKDIETLILRISKPKGNSVRGRLPRKYRLNKILQREIAQKTDELSGLKKELKPGAFKPKARKGAR